MRATEHAPRGPFRVLERRHGLAEIVERGARADRLSPAGKSPHCRRHRRDQEHRGDADVHHWYCPATAFGFLPSRFEFTRFGAFGRNVTHRRAGVSPGRLSRLSASFLNFIRIFVQGTHRALICLNPTFINL